MEQTKSGLTRKSEEHAKLNTDLLLLTALIKTHKAKRAQQPVIRARLSVSDHDQPRQHVQRQQQFVHGANRKYSYKKTRTHTDDRNVSHRVKLVPRGTSLKKDALCIMSVKKTPKTKMQSARGGGMTRKDSYRYVVPSKRLSQKPTTIDESSSTQRWRSSDNAEDVVGSTSRSLASYQGEHAKASTDNLDGRRRRDVVLPDDKLTKLQIRTVQDHRPSGNSTSTLNLPSCPPHEQKKSCLSSSSSIIKVSSNRTTLGSSEHVSSRVCLHKSKSPSVRIDAIRTACIKSFAALKETGNAASVSEQLQNKDCEIARIKALSAYLNQLEHKRHDANVTKSVKASKCKQKITLTVTDAKLGSNITKPQSVVKTSTSGAPQTCFSVNHDLTRKATESKLAVCPATKTDQVASTQQQIQELRDDIKRLEVKLNSKTLVTMAQIGEKRSQRSVPTADVQNVTLKGQRLSSDASGFKMMRTSNRETQNPFKKVKTSPGSRSLHKTRSRYKVRRSSHTLPSRERHFHADMRQRNRRGIRKASHVAGQSSPHLRQSKITKKFVHSPTQYHHICHQPQSASLRYGSDVSPYGSQRKQLDWRYSLPYMVHGHRTWRGLWGNYNKNSFVSRRIQHAVTHSPMLFRSSPFLRRKRYIHQLGSIWHSPNVFANQLRWQVAKAPNRVYGSPLLPPCYTPTNLHHSPSRTSRRWLQQSPSKHNIAGKTGSKKVMNVVKLGGVRYARHWKSLRRLSNRVEGPIASSSSQQHGTSPVSHRKITNTKIVAQQVLQRSIFYSRISKSRKRNKQEYCMFYNRFGRCNKGTTCPYKHDPDKVAVCTRFLRGTCKPTGGPCPFSHKLSREKMPVCRFFLKGICAQVDCPYSHVKVNDSASVCRDFVRGFCAKGETCTQKHLLECAEYTKIGKCSRKHCPLWHKNGRKQSTMESQRGQKPLKRIHKVMKKPSEVSDNGSVVPLEKRKPSALSDSGSFIELEKRTPSEMSNNASFVPLEKRSPSALSNNGLFIELEKRTPTTMSENASIVPLEKRKPSEIPFTELQKMKRPLTSGNASFIELEKNVEENSHETTVEEGTNSPLQIRPIFLKTMR